jgi:hypothetical protein
MFIFQHLKPIIGPGIAATALGLMGGDQRVLTGILVLEREADSEPLAGEHCLGLE